MKTTLTGLLGVAVLCSSSLAAQSNAVPADAMTPRNIKAIGYQVGGGSTTIDLKSVGDIPASGQPKVQAKPAVTAVDAEIQGLRSPTQTGAECWTYVLRAGSPDRQDVNMATLLP